MAHPVIGHEVIQESFFHWCGVRPDTAPVIQTIRAQLLNA